MTDKTKVAVYGTLRQGEGNHALLERSEGVTYLGTTTLKPEWKMLSLGGFPALIRCADCTASPVVEVYEVPNEVLEGPLDMLEGYPGWYTRQLVPTEYGMAWLYFFPEDADVSDLPVIEGGDWVEFNKEN